MNNSLEPIDIFLSRLPAYTRSGPASFKACCPAHDDKTPSLSIKRLPDGRLLIHCFAGCGAIDVLDSMALDYGDLYPDSGYYEPVGKSKEMSHDEWILFIGKNSTKPLSEKDKKKVLQAKIRELKKSKETK